MKITSRASDYALILLLHLAALKPDETTNVKKVAGVTHLSLRFLANIANKLSIGRIIVSSRGVHGGIKLGRPINKISVKDVIEAVDGPIQTMFCQNTHELCNFEQLCQMKFFWDDIQGTVMEKLNDTTIEDLLAHKLHGGGSFKRQPEAMQPTMV